MQQEKKSCNFIPANRVPTGGLQIESDARSRRELKGLTTLNKPSMSDAVQARTNEWCDGSQTRSQADSVGLSPVEDQVTMAIQAPETI